MGNTRHAATEIYKQRFHQGRHDTDEVHVCRRGGRRIATASVEQRAAENSSFALIVYDLGSRPPDDEISYWLIWNIPVNRFS